MTMTDLSPAAQRVLDAANASATNAWSDATHQRFRSGIAAALRAAADQVVPFPGRYPMNDYMEGFRDAKQSVHHQLLAIAAELEGNA
jgi:hypothetical protein